MENHSDFKSKYGLRFARNLVFRYTKKCSLIGSRVLGVGLSSVPLVRINFETYWMVRPAFMGFLNLKQNCTRNITQQK